MANYPSGSGKVLAAGSGCRVPRRRGSPVLGMQAAACPAAALLLESWNSSGRKGPFKAISSNPQRWLLHQTSALLSAAAANLCPGTCSIVGCGGGDTELAFLGDTWPGPALPSGQGWFRCLL